MSLKSMLLSVGQGEVLTMQQRRSLQIAFLLTCAVLFPMCTMSVSAHPSIGLSVDTAHVQLTPGDSTNVTLTIDNNGSSIEDFSVSVVNQSLPNSWDVIATSTLIENVLPTFSTDTTIVVRLNNSGAIEDSGNVTIVVSQNGTNVSSTIVIQLSVMPMYGPLVDASGVGDNGLVTMAPDSSLDLTVEVTNGGNVLDTFLLNVDSEPDLAAWWLNYTSGGNNSGGNNSGNNSGGNNSGNNSGGNNSGNNTGGNNSGNGTGNGTSMGGPRTIPNGWSVYFVDDIQSNMSPGETRSVILRVIAPGNAQAGYHGFNLFSASAYGNISFSTTFVVNITAIHDIQFRDVTPETNWLPGLEGNITVEITNVGSVSASHYYDISSTEGECSFNLLDGSGGEISPNASENVLISVIPSTNSHLNETCEVQLEARNVDHPSSIFTSSFNITIGVAWELEFSEPTSNVSVIPGQHENQQLAIWNLGTEDDTAWFEAISPAGINVTVPDGWTSISRGSSSLIEVIYGVPSDTDLLGDYIVSIIAHSQSSEVVSAEINITITILQRDEISVEGPTDNRITVPIDSSSTANFTVENTGTSDVVMAIGSTGLPIGATLTIMNSDLSLSSGSSKDIEIMIETDTTSQSGNYPLTISFYGGESSVDYVVTLQVQPRISVSISTSSNWAVVGASEPAVLSIEIANLGDLQDIVGVTIDDSNLAGIYGVSMDSQNFNLDGGEISTANLTITKLDFTNQEVILNLIATSSLDSSVIDSLSITVFPHSASVNLTALSLSETVAVGSELEGTLYVTNKGNSEDTFLISTFGLDCNLTANAIVLGAGQTHEGVDYTCPISSNIISGPHAFQITATSQADTGKAATVQIPYNVLSNRIDDAVSIMLQSDTMTMNYDGGSTITVTVTNLVNDVVSGSLSVGGTNAELVTSNWTAQNSMNESLYSLSPGESSSFVLSLSSVSEQGGELSLVITAVSEVDGMIVVDESSPLSVIIDSKHQPPDGLVIPFGFELENGTALNILYAGWIVALLCILLLRFRGKRSDDDFSTDAMQGGAEIISPPIESPTNEANETMLLDGRKVICPSCATRCTVPRGSVPPFRFTCPACEEKIRVTG